jgi:hypothetical protein
LTTGGRSELLVLEDAVNHFRDATRHCDNMITTHRRASPGRGGRRTVEASINRSTIVLTVASWQAFVQDVALALRDAATTELAAASSGHLVHAAMKQWKHDFTAGIEKFSTPGPDQTRTLFKRAGFDPLRSWTWKQRGGQGHGSFLVEPKHVTTVINHWLTVRHELAHGHTQITASPVLGAARSSRAHAIKSPTVRLTDAIDCLAFFRALAYVTAGSAATFLGVNAPEWDPAPKLALGINALQLNPASGRAS